MSPAVGRRYHTTRELQGWGQGWLILPYRVRGFADMLSYFGTPQLSALAHQLNWKSDGRRIGGEDVTQFGVE